MGLPQPKTILAHGWWLSGGAKMGKTLGNVVNPVDMAGIYGVDAFRYFLIRDMVLGRDADFTEQNLRNRYQADLANDFGNLLHRLVNMIGRYCHGYVPLPGAPISEDVRVRDSALAVVDRAFELVEALAPNEALTQIMGVVSEVNQYLERMAPWSLARQGPTERVNTIFIQRLSAATASLLLQPACRNTWLVWRRLGWQPGDVENGTGLGSLAARKPSSPVPLFPKDVA